MFAGFLVAMLGTGCVTPGGGGTELFNGKNLDGWEPTPGGKWEVKDGVIIGTTPATIELLPGALQLVVQDQFQV